MEFLLLRIFPVLLGLGGMVILPLEVRTFLRERAAGKPRTLKFCRRALGGLVLISLACMVFFGEIPAAAEQTPEAWRQFKYWLTVLGLTLFLMMLAVWDAMDGVRYLRGYLEGVEREEIRRIHEHLGRAQVSVEPASPNGKPAPAPDL